jgi:uncharacterized membrane protein YdbT with pleckstrin-like domain
MGSYAETLLAPGEVIVHRSHQHWLSLLLESRVAIALWATVVVTVILSWLTHFEGTFGTALFWIEIGALVLGVIVVAWRWWHWRTEEYVITNRRLLKVTGIINKRSGDSSLEKINDAILEENLIGRLLNYGDLDILTAAEIAVDRYRMLAKAKDFKKAMLEAKHSLESGYAFGDMATQRAVQANAAQAAAAPAAPAQPAAPLPLADPVDTAEEVTAALGRLAELRDSGAITASDYELKKRELLSRL